MHFTIPLRLISTANAREHWRAVAKRKKEHRELGAMWTRKVFRSVILPGRRPGVLVVTITRIGKRKLDDDNLSHSAKFLRDGIADGLGVDDGDTEKVRWVYAQQTGKEYGVHVRIDIE